MKNIDFVIMGLQPWDIELGSNCKNIALELAKEHRVLYINRALDRVSTIRYRNDKKIKARLRARRGNEDSLQQERENLWVLNPNVMLESINWITSKPVFDYLNKVNGIRLSHSINQSINLLGFNRIVLLIDNDFLRGYYLKGFVRNDITAYYLRDYLIEQKYFRAHGARLERALLTKVDVVFANSSYLADYASQYNRCSYDVGQGCELSSFKEKRAIAPQDLNAISKPIIGYVGALLSSRLDIELIDAIAQERLDWNIVLVGPEDDTFRNSVLHIRLNVHFLGKKQAEQVPDYVYGFDVCINPQQVNSITRGNYPRKIDEYLVAGKPVVATNTEAMQPFAEHVYLCKGLSEYLIGIERALEEKDDKVLIEKRKNLALSHTWENSVAKMTEQLQKFTNLIS